MKVKCPRCNSEPAIVDRVYGVLIGKNCQKSDDVPIRRSPEFYSLNKMDRVTRGRDWHSKDIIQPFMGGKPNRDFLKAYPKKAKDYYTKEQLKNME